MFQRTFVLRMVNILQKLREYIQPKDMYLIDDKEQAFNENVNNAHLNKQNVKSSSWKQLELPPESQLRVKNNSYKNNTFQLTVKKAFFKLQ